MVTSSSGGVLLVLQSVYISLVVHNNSNSFLFLTSRRTKVACTEFWCVLLYNLMRRAGSLPCPFWPLGRSCVSAREVTYLEVKYSSNWPISSSRFYFCTCSACQIKKIKNLKKGSNVRSVMCDFALGSAKSQNLIRCHQIGMYKKKCIFPCFLQCITTD